MTAHGHVTAAPHRREGYTLRAARQPRSSERDLGADSSRTQLDGRCGALTAVPGSARLGPGCWSREWCLVGMGALGHGSGTILPLYHSPTVLPDAPRGTATGPCAAVFHPVYLYGVWSWATCSVPCPVLSCDTTKFSNRFLGQFCATEPNLRKPNLRKRAETCKARYRCHPSPPNGRSEALGTTLNWKRSASRCARSQQRRPNPSRTDVRPARAHDVPRRPMLRRQTTNQSPPKARHFAQRKVAAPAPTVSQTSRQPTAQKRPPPSR